MTRTTRPRRAPDQSRIERLFGEIQHLLGDRDKRAEFEAWALDLNRRGLAGAALADGFRGSGGDGRGGSSSTSVEAAVLARAVPQFDEVASRRDSLLRVAALFSQALAELNDLRTHDLKRQEVPVASEQGERYCVEEKCERKVEPGKGRHGRCEACARWRWSRLVEMRTIGKSVGVDETSIGYELVPPVPAEVLAKRAPQDGSVRVHVTGPDAVEVEDSGRPASVGKLTGEFNEEYGEAS